MVRLRFDGMADTLVASDETRPVVEALATILPNWPLAEPDSMPDRIQLVGRAGEYAIDSPWLQTPQLAETPTAAACALIIELARSWLFARPGLLCLHCAAYERNGRLIVIAGTNRSGKSTLAAALGAAGARIFCDDMLPLTQEGLGVALGVPPRLRLPLPDNLEDSLVAKAAATMICSDERYGYTLPPRLARHGETAPLGGIVLLDRVPENDTHFSAIARSEALAHLLLRNLHRDMSATDAMARLLDIASTVPAARMTYSDVDEAVAGLLALDPDDWPDTKAETGGDWHPDPADQAQVDSQLLYCQRSGVTTQTVDGDIFAVHPQNEEIFRLNPIAAVIWDLFEEPASLTMVADLLNEAFPDERHERLASDAVQLMASLISRDLIRPVN